MKLKSLLLGTAIIASSALIFGCSKDDESKNEPETPPTTKVKTYINPVFAEDFSDPSVLRADDGYFYAFCGARILRSGNLTTWTKLPAAFEGVPWPSWSDVCNEIWATDCVKIGNQYVLYYALAKWMEVHKTGIGVAVSNKPQGPYTDKGKLFISDEIGVTNSIDAQFFRDDDGKQYLTWGSFHGIYIIELSADGLSIKTGARKMKIASSYEGSMLHKHDGKYYLFTSNGTCCDGMRSTYQVCVGRADKIDGPYLDKAGESMLNDHHEVLIHGREEVAGPGHNSQIITDDNGQDWIFYHGYTSYDSGRVLFMDPVNWVDGWPVVKDQVPCLTKQPAPVFNLK